MIRVRYLDAAGRRQHTPSDETFSAAVGRALDLEAHGAPIIAIVCPDGEIKWDDALALAEASERMKLPAR